MLEPNIMPELSVILPIRNEENHIRAIIEGLLDQSLDKTQYEIIVVDGMSSDSTLNIVEKLQVQYPLIRTFSNPGFTSAHARNIGAKEARGEFILFVDGHCTIKYSKMLQMVLNAFQRGDKCISRPQPLIPEGGSIFQKAVLFARNSKFGHYSGSNIFESKDYYCNPMSAGCGYNKSLFLSLGGIDTSFDAAEDLEFNYRVYKTGVRAFHSQYFSLEYRPRKSFSGLFRQMYRYGYGRALLAKKFPSFFSPFVAILAIFSLIAVMMPILGVWLKPVFFAWKIGIISYLAVLLLLSGGLSKLGSFRLFCALNSCFLAIHFGAGFGYLSGMLGGPSLSHRPKRTH